MGGILRAEVLARLPAVGSQDLLAERRLISAPFCVVRVFVQLALARQQSVSRCPICIAEKCALLLLSCETHFVWSALESSSLVVNGSRKKAVDKAKERRG